MYKLSDLDGIIFDMDGVIFDSERLGLKSWLILGDKYGFSDVETNAKKCIGRSTVDTMQILNKAYGKYISIEKLYDEAKNIMAELIEKEGLPLKEGAVELLKFLKENKTKVGLASSTSYNGVIRNLKSVGLLDCFQVIVGGDMITHSKPEPEIYLLACEKLGVNPQKTLAIEDSYNGIISAYRAKMKPVLVPDLIEPNEEMLDKSYIMFESLSQLYKKISTTGI